MKVVISEKAKTILRLSGQHTRVSTAAGISYGAYVNAIRGGNLTMKVAIRLMHYTRLPFEDCFEVSA